MNINDKIRKVKELVNRGATPGEKAAARKALERLAKAHGYNLDADGSVRNVYKFPYNRTIDLDLAWHIITFFEIDCKVLGRFPSNRQFHIEMELDDHTVFDCSYGYFRPHMNGQWLKNVTPLIRRCRTAKGKRQRQQELQQRFMSNYMIRSGLVKSEHIVKAELSGKAAKAAAQLEGVQGGKYNEQLNTGLYLD